MASSASSLTAITLAERLRWSTSECFAFKSMNAPLPPLSSRKAQALYCNIKITWSGPRLYCECIADSLALVQIAKSISLSYMQFWSGNSVRFWHLHSCFEIWHGVCSRCYFRWSLMDIDAWRSGVTRWKCLTNAARAAQPHTCQFHLVMKIVVVHFQQLSRQRLPIRGNERHCWLHCW